VLENVVYDDAHHHVDFDNSTITQNTRGAYPIEHMPTARVPCMAEHPSDVIFLTCDAFGVLPPVSKLTPELAMFHFVNGYTAKVAGTEMGVKDPQATFSPCFGGPFLVWHPNKYAELLAEKVKRHQAQVWLVNTGWAGGSYGGGQRMPLAYTRAIVDAIHAGSLRDAPTVVDPIFGLHVVTQCPTVPAELLQPWQSWADRAAYDATAKKLAASFQKNYEAFQSGGSTGMMDG
jgi:phosphoenolpyruvate carboxykinase (ATP)